MHFIAIQIFFLLFHFLNVSCEPLIYFHSLLMGHDPLFGKHCLNWSTGTARERENFCGVIGGEVWKKEYDSFAQVQKFLDVIYFIFKIYPALSIDTKQDHLFFIKGFKSPNIINRCSRDTCCVILGLLLLRICALQSAKQTVLVDKFTPR